MRGIADKNRAAGGVVVAAAAHLHGQSTGVGTSGTGDSMTTNVASNNAENKVTKTLQRSIVTRFNSEHKR